MKRSLSIVLVAIMILTSFPLNIVSAAETVSWMIEDFKDLSDCSVSGLGSQTTQTVNGYSTVTGNATSVNFNKSINPVVSITNYEKNYLALNMKFYIEDPAQLKNSGAPQIEITSSGKCDVNEMHWSITSLDLKSGWNDLTLNFSSGVPTGGELDITNINYTRIYFSLSSETKVGFGPITIVPTHGGVVFDGSLAIVKENMTSMPQSAEGWVKPTGYNDTSWIISNCNGTDGVYDSYGGTTLRAVTEGTSTYLQTEVPVGGHFSIRKDMTKGNDVVLPQGYTKNELTLSLQFYVSDVTAVPNGSLEIASTGMDQDEVSWLWESLNLKNGWNDLRLNLGKPHGTNGNFSVTSVKWFRFYSGALTAPCTIKIDDIKIILAEDDNEWLITDFDNTDLIPITDSCSNNTKTYETVNGASVLKCVVPASQWISLRHETMPASVGINLPANHTMNDLALAFRVYVEDVTRIGSVNIEVANTHMDTNEIFWNLSSLSSLKNGWNEIVLPFSTGFGPVGGEFIVSQIKWWRFNFNVTDAGQNTFMLDYLKIVSLVQKEDVPASEYDHRMYLFTFLGDNGNNQALFTDQKGNLGWMDNDTEIMLGTALSDNEWYHVAYTLDPATKVLTVYVNGQVAATKTLSGDMPGSGDFRIGIGPDGFDGAVFSRQIGDVRVWTDVRTAAEIANNHQVIINTATDGLFANWRLNDDFSFISAVPSDSVGNNHATALWRKWDSDWVEYEETDDYSYTMAVVPDPQILAALYPDVYYKMFQYIADNINDQNIKYVLGLGDITNSNSEAEWKVARKAFDYIEGKVPYANVLGNHDYGDWTQPYRDTTRYNTYFKHDDHAKRSDWGGAYESGKLDNVYYCFDVGNVPYMVLCLEFLPRDGAMAWANSVVAAHPERNVIVMTHGYINGSDGQIGSEPQSDYGFIINNPDPYNGGQKIWEKLISQHENIVMSLCGHTFCKDDNVIMRADKGVNGNTVTQLCINAQTLDEKYFEKTGVGLLGLLRFSENGRDVALQYYSPHTNKCFREVNQMTFTLDVVEQQPFTEWKQSLAPMYHVGLQGTDSSDTNWENYRYIAQSFVPAENTLYGVKLPLNLTSDDATLHLEIRSSMNGSVLASGETKITSKGDGMYWYEAYLDEPLAVDVGTPYCFVYYLTARHSGSVCIAYGSDLGANNATTPGGVWQMASGEPITFSTLNNQHHFGFELMANLDGFVYGDVNDDGVVSATDALLALQHSVKKLTLTGKKLLAADVTSTYSEVTSADALAILQYSVELIDRFDVSNK